MDFEQNYWQYTDVVDPQDVIFVLIVLSMLS